MEIGYVRGLADHSGLSMQIDALKKFGCERIFQDNQDSFDERPAGLSADAIKIAKEAKQLYKDDSMAVADIAKTLGIGKTTLYRYLHYMGADIVQKSVSGIKLSNEKLYKDKVRKELFRKLLESKAFWSYSYVKVEKISDDILIQKVMEELDIHDIKKLFLLYNKSYIKSVWKNEMVIQDPYY